MVRLTEILLTSPAAGGEWVWHWQWGSEFMSCPYAKASAPIINRRPMQEPGPSSGYQTLGFAAQAAYLRILESVAFSKCRLTGGVVLCGAGGEPG